MYLRLDENILDLIHIFGFFLSLIPLSLFIFFKLTFYKNMVRLISTYFIKTFFGSALSASSITSCFFLNYICKIHSPDLFSIIVTSTCVYGQLGFVYHYYMKTNKIAIIDA